MISVMLGGFFGAMSRFLISKTLSSINRGFPFPTLIINSIGSFLLGIVLASEMSQTTYQLIGIGFLGAFTTFSTFSYETLQLMTKGQFVLATYYCVGSIILGASAFFLALSIF